MSDRDGKVESFSINTIPGNTMPRFDAATTELRPLHATITERGMASGWPSVDVVFEPAQGEGRYVFTTSGRMLLMLAGAIQAAVIRNRHEPDYVPVLALALEGKHPQAASFERALGEISEAILTRLREHGAYTSDTMREALRAALLDVVR
jgi:hypothetical protein